MLYGRSDIQSLNIPATGHKHARRKGNEKGAFQLDCVECEASPLTKVALGITAEHPGTSPESAPLTEGETSEREAAREQMLLGQMSEFEEFRAWQRARRAGTAPA